MHDFFVSVWDILTFYGPAAYSILAVAASGIAALIVWHFVKKGK